MISLLLPNNFYPVDIVPTSSKETESDELLYTVRGHSLWSANRLPAQEVKDREGLSATRSSDQNVSWFAEDTELSSEESTTVEGIRGSLPDDAIAGEKVFLRLPSGKNENCYDWRLYSSKQAFVAITSMSPCNLFRYIDVLLSIGWPSKNYTYALCFVHVRSRNANFPLIHKRNKLVR